MIIQSPFGIANRRIFAQKQNQTAAFNPAAPAKGMTARDIARRLQENQEAQLREAHERVRQQQQEQRRRPPRRTGAVRLSNTDSLGRAFQIRARLMSKLNEIAMSDADDRSRGAMKIDIKLQLDRVERQISAIRRRQRAVEEERTTRRRDDTPERRRRRSRDMQEQRIFIRRDFLYHANNGGFDPNDPLFLRANAANAVSPIAFDFGGKAGTMDIAAADAGMEVDFNMEVVL